MARALRAGISVSGEEFGGAERGWRGHEGLKTEAWTWKGKEQKEEEANGNTRNTEG